MEAIKASQVDFDGLGLDLVKYTRFQECGILTFYSGKPYKHGGKHYTSHVVGFDACLYDLMESFDDPKESEDAARGYISFIRMRYMQAVKEKSKVRWVRYSWEAIHHQNPDRNKKIFKEYGQDILLHEVKAMAEEWSKKVLEPEKEFEQWYTEGNEDKPIGHPDHLVYRKSFGNYTLEIKVL